MDKLTDRKRKVIESIIDDYVENASPVSSSEIQKNYMNDYSSATIRNEMSALEEMGYLIQPHSSSGRIPSTKAYRYYFNNCLNEVDKVNALKDVEDMLVLKLDNIKDIMVNAAKIISDKTNYTTILYKESKTDIEIESIKLLPLTKIKALIVIFTTSGLLHEKLIDIPETIKLEQYINNINDNLNNIFKGVKLNDLEKIDYYSKIKIQLEDYAIIFDKIYNILKEGVNNSNKEFILEGKNKIFEYKEYEDINNVKNFLQIIDEKDKLKNIIKSDDNSIEISIKIGKDEEECLENMAIVSASCKISEEETVRAAVIGPERMDYKKVKEVLSSVKKSILEIINKK